MKIKTIQSTILASGLLLSSSVFAQDTSMVSRQDAPRLFTNGEYRTWSIGVHGGLLFPKTFLGGSIAAEELDYGYGGYIKKQVLPNLGLKANFLRGMINYTTTTGGEDIKTNINWSGSLDLDFTIATINLRHRKNVLQPYLTVGGGMIAHNYAPAPATNNEDMRKFFIPVGAGLKFNISNGVNFNLGYNTNFVDSYNFANSGDIADDAVIIGIGNNRFSYAHAGLEFAFGGSGKPQLAGRNAVTDLEADYSARYDALKMDMDAQKQEMAAERQRMTQEMAQLKDQLLRDTDNDGVIDMLDKCPNTQAGVKVDGAGCPLPERKPDVKVYITEEDRKVVKEAIQNLEFDSGKATIRDRSFPSLDKVAQLLVDKNFSLKLAGHTDNVGKPASNLALSKARAESIKEYLVSKGANSSRIEAVGYGQTQPIASNKTAAGKQQNRRVEFTLY